MEMYLDRGAEPHYISQTAELDYISQGVLQVGVSSWCSHQQSERRSGLEVTSVFWPAKSGRVLSKLPRIGLWQQPSCGRAVACGRVMTWGVEPGAPSDHEEPRAATHPRSEIWEKLRWLLLYINLAGPQSPDIWVSSIVDVAVKVFYRGD